MEAVEAVEASVTEVPARFGWSWRWNPEWVPKNAGRFKCIWYGETHPKIWMVTGGSSIFRTPPYMSYDYFWFIVKRWALGGPKSGYILGMSRMRVWELPLVHCAWQVRVFVNKQNQMHCSILSLWRISHEQWDRHKHTCERDTLWLQPTPEHTCACSGCS